MKWVTHISFEVREVESSKLNIERRQGPFFGLLERLLVDRAVSNSNCLVHYPQETPTSVVFVTVAGSYPSASCSRLEKDCPVRKPEQHKRKIASQRNTWIGSPQNVSMACVLNCVQLPNGWVDGWIMDRWTNVPLNRFFE